jgi:glycosyltransferase involved in cell wall biosynthesis
MVDCSQKRDRHVEPAPESAGAAVAKCRMPSITTVSGSFGAEVQNGVGRFLAGLFDWSVAQNYPLTIFSAGAHIARYPGVQNVHPLTFSIPGGFQNIAAYYPLEGRRKQLARSIEDLDSDIVHISTPEALGATALAIARRQRRLIAGIYHTDFPAFARHMVHKAVATVNTNGPDPRNGPLASLCRRVSDEYKDATTWWERRLLSWIGRRVLRRNSGKLGGVLNLSADRLSELAESAVHGLMARFYGRFDLVIARSEIYRRRLIDEMGLLPGRVRTLRAGVDTRIFSPRPAREDDNLRVRLALPPAAKVVLYVGRVTDEKNVGFLADAWRSFSQRRGRRGLETVFVAVGDGNLEEFRRRAGPGVRMFGPAHGETLSALYRRADLFWTASTTETLGQVVLEAQASGVPVMVSDRGAARENVADGETGFVLPVDSPARWAQEVSRLLADDEGRRAMAAAARTLAEERTIEASYRHYWELHRQLSERAGNRLIRYRHSWRDMPEHSLAELDKLGGDGAEVLRRPGQRSPGFRRLNLGHPRTMGGAPSIHLSDFHAGRQLKRIPKESALRAACQRAAERGARLFLHGDFLDTRPPLHKVRRDVKLVRGIFEEYGVVPELYLEGNHDYEFARGRRIEGLLGCPSAPSLVHLDRASGLVLTHGHVSEVPGIHQLIARSRDRDELVRALSVDRLQEPLRASAFKYDLVGLIANSLEDAGLNGLEDAWRAGLHVRRWLADQLMEAARQRGFDDHMIRAVIQMIGSSDREEVLSRLGAALGGWGLVYGHTHEPHVSRRRVIDPLTGKPRTILLGNCGSFCRRSIPPTWIESDFPHLELWAFQPDKSKAELIDRASLTAKEAAPYEWLWEVATVSG